MKKIILTAIILIGILVSCSEDFTSNPGREYVLQSQLDELAERSPEALLTISKGMADGNDAQMRSYNVSGSTAHDDYGQKSVDLNLDLMSNDMTQSIFSWHGGAYNYTYRGVESIRGTHTIWKFYYTIIRNANIIIRLVPSDIEDAELKGILGRAHAIRGFSYFNLIRLYSNGEVGVPLIMDSSEQFNRVSTQEVLDTVKSDYDLAYGLLNGYERSSKDAIDQNVVAGLIARYALGNGDYTTAVTMARQARASATLLPFESLNDGFDDINNPEWIWGATITNETSTIYASFFSHMGTLNNGYAGLLKFYKNIDKRLYDAIPATDGRKAWFLDGSSAAPYANVKFIDDTFFEGDYLYMRASEMVLIEAEALALGGDDAGAAQALYELVSKRDDTYTMSSNTGQALLDEIRLQRSIELWGEGFAFYDMKRWNRGLVRTYTGTNHPTYGRLDYPAGSPKFVFQIPQAELDSNNEITEQNPN